MFRFAESEVIKLETLMQTEVTVVTTGEAVGADAAMTPPSLRRRKRTCSRRQGEKDREREGGGMGGGDRGDRGVGEDRDRREASKSRETVHEKLWVNNEARAKSLILSFVQNCHLVVCFRFCTETETIALKKRLELRHLFAALVSSSQST